MTRHPVEGIATSDGAIATAEATIATIADHSATTRRGGARRRAEDTTTIHGGTMQTAQGNMLDSLRNVKTFLDDHATLLAGVVKTGTRNSLLEAIANLAAHQDTQAGSNLAAKGSTQVQHALRQTLLKDHMSVISRIARASLPNTPAIEPLRMPRGKPSLSKLASDAYGMASAAEAHTDVFVAAGLPDDFVTQLRSAADAMIGAGTDRSASRGRRGGATKGLKSQLTAGRRIVGVLDAMVKTALRHDPALLANWNIVKRVARVTSKSTTTTPAPAPAPTPTPSPVPVATTAS